MVIRVYCNNTWAWETFFLSTLTELKRHTVLLGQADAQQILSRWICSSGMTTSDLSFDRNVADR